MYTGLNYGTPSGNGAEPARRITIFSDRAHIRDQLREDIQTAELHVVDCGPLSLLHGQRYWQTGDVILADYPAIDAAGMAQLCKLDTQIAKTQAKLIISTTMGALDDVFGCVDQSMAQLLVEPTRSEWLIALGNGLAGGAPQRVRELSEEDRLVLLRLTEQVAQMAERLNRIEPPAADTQPASPPEEGSAFPFSAQDTAQPARTSRPPLPDPRLVRRIIRQRQLRGRFFDAELFADPAWDMLLDLTAARAEHKRVSVTSLCIASGVPPTTALRWINQMTEFGLLARIEDDIDRRRAFIALTDKAADAMARYFQEAGHDIVRTS